MTSSAPPPPEDPLALSVDPNSSTTSPFEILTQEILLASSHHDIATLRSLLSSTASSSDPVIDADPRVKASVKDPETGYTPLHAVIASLAHDDDAPNTTERHITANGHANGAPAGDEERRQEMERAVKTAKLLLQNGAIWNELDAGDETPGCLARRLGLSELYEVCVDAGVRAELLFNRLDGVKGGWEELGSEADGASDEGDSNDAPDRVVDTVINADRAEDPQVEAFSTTQRQESPQDEANQPTFLHSALSLTPRSLIDPQNNAVMMSWESDLMRRTAQLLLPHEGLCVLNIGFGMGIIDTFFQSHKPKTHHIIEPHPCVLTSLKSDSGFLATQHQRRNDVEIVLHEGTWQDILPQLIAAGTTFDAIFFDTYAEPYSAFRNFFEEHVIGLLEEGGKWSFFNGMGADRRVCYDVYGKVVEMELFEAGFDVKWEEVELPAEVMEGGGVWEGTRRRYYDVDVYRLPVCEFIG